MSDIRFELTIPHLARKDERLWVREYWCTVELKSESHFSSSTPVVANNISSVHLYHDPGGSW